LALSSLEFDQYEKKSRSSKKEKFDVRAKRHSGHGEQLHRWSTLHLYMVFKILIHTRAAYNFLASGKMMYIVKGARKKSCQSFKTA